MATVHDEADSDGDAALALDVIESGRYLVLATAAADGSPWPTPVWYARSGREFFWVSRSDTRHSDNVRLRGQVSFVIFETPVPPQGRTHAVYAEAIAAEVPAEDLERCLATYEHRARAEGLGGWTIERVVAPAAMRLYRAVAARIFVLHPDRDIRREVEIDL